MSGDNTQYIYSPTGLPAGTYALLITGDPSLLATVGMSYTLAGSFATTWNSSSGGSWGMASLWTNGIPNGQAAQANLLTAPGITSPSTITLDGNRTVGQMTFNNSNGYTIAQGAIESGISGTLTIDDAGDSTGTANPLINVISGSQTISAPVNLIAGVTTNISSGSTLTISGAITGAGGLTKTGAGTLALSAVDAYTTLSSTNTPDGSTIIDGGTLLLTPTGSIDSGPIVINAGGTLNFAANNTAGILVRTVPGSITINSSGSVVVSPTTVLANRQLLVASAGLSIAGSTNNWTGKLDLGNNDLDVPAGNLATLTNQIAEGYNGGRWNGASGIISSAAAANTTHLTTLGVIVNSTSGTTPLYGSGTALGTFDGTSPAATDVLVKYTYYGDANLDGSVSASDYSLIDNGYLNHLTGWYNGDFNYDGVINGSDYTLIDNAYNMQGSPITSNTTEADAIATIQIAGTSSVPEPAAGVVLGLGLLSSLGRRRRGKM